MFLLRGFFSEINPDGGVPVDLTVYAQYRYLGQDTVLKLPPVNEVSETVFLKTFEVFSLPVEFDWVIRAVDDGRLEVV